ncbi:unnamed protein product [Bursaphelenchus okinawaensis]|uniref:Uncharacterized protein n=1 Tax=Bursaphelenchus okinawaensis TaxID=465554 RepID=A0A811KBU9_9BILA|nr:unnamed protein product [Bursaphelenchus okinawaensis]CAG9097790.1 unnamed protein product [Bursaphelenchus okinawaensis]
MFAPAVWSKIIGHVEFMEDVAALATINKEFYKFVGVDFKKICHDNLIVRGQTDECWADVVRDAEHRLFYNCTNNFTWCRFTGALAVKQYGNKVLLANLDFSTAGGFVISAPSEIVRLQFINRGTHLIITTEKGLLLFDTINKVYLANYRCNYFKASNYVIQVDDQKIFDMYTQQVVDFNYARVTFIYYNNPTDYRKHLVLMNKQEELIVLNLETMEQVKLCNLFAEEVQVRILAESESVLVDDQDRFTIFSLITGEVLYDGWLTYSMNRSILSENVIEFLDKDEVLYYDSQAKQWISKRVQSRISTAVLSDYYNIPNNGHSTIHFVNEKAEMTNFFYAESIKNELFIKSFKPAPYCKQWFEQPFEKTVNDILIAMDKRIQQETQTEFVGEVVEFQYEDPEEQLMVQRCIENFQYVHEDDRLNGYMDFE